MNQPSSATDRQASRSSRERFDREKQRLRQGDGGGRTEEEPDNQRSGQERKKEPRHRGAIELVRAFWGLATDHRHSILLALLGLTLATLLGLLPPVAIKIVFDNVLGEELLPQAVLQAAPSLGNRRLLLGVVLGAVLLISSLTMGIRIFTRWLATRTGLRVGVAVRRRVFEHALRLPLHRIQDLQTGGVTSFLREDAGAAGSLAVGLFYDPWRAVVELAGILLVLAWVAPTMLLGGLILLPLVVFTHRAWIGRIRPMWRAARHTRRRTDGEATQSIAGVRIVRTYDRDATEAGRFIRNNHLMMRQEVQAWWWSRGVHATWGILVPVASAALLWYGGLRILDDRALLSQGAITSAEALTIGELVMFLTYIIRLLDPLSQLAASATQVQNSLAGFDRTLDLLEEEVEVRHAPGALVLPETTGPVSLSMSGVTFTYPGSENPVLQDITLDILPGETIALVGPSGAGKTTLCNLVARFQDPNEGQILLDGIDIAKIELSSYRRRLAVVEQDVFLFEGTISENIAYGRRNATHDDVLEITRKLGIERFIEKLPNGYETRVGERGVRLSGGQRQQLAIARALLANPALLILDEATSHLDPLTEARIREGLGLLLGNRTGLVIAHRASTIAMADRIVYLEEGKVIDFGPHEELVERNEAYRQMVVLQTEAYRINPLPPSSREEEVN